MWIKKLEISNLKCFENLTLSFEHPTHKPDAEPEPYRWITLLGENGAGKSTILQCAALLLAGPEAAGELLSRPYGWLKNPDASRGGRMRVTLHQDTQAVGNGQASEMDPGDYQLQGRMRNFTYSYYVTGYVAEDREPIKIQSTPYREPQIVMERSSTLNWLRTNALYSGNKGWFAAGYGPFRRLSNKDEVIAPTLPPSARFSNFISLFKEDEPIRSYEQWLAYLESQKNRSAADIEKALGLIQSTLPELLPRQQGFSGQNHKIRPAGVDERNRARLQMNDTDVISSPGWADGFRSVVAFAGDLIWRLFSAFPHLDNVTQAGGVVIIDELDTHLHPAWQRFIPQWLQKTFPNLQFIVSTHSPMIAAGAGADALTLHFFWKGNTATYEKVDDIWFYEVDSILRSPAFRLGSTYAPHMEQKIERYKQLRSELYQIETSRGVKSQRDPQRIGEIKTEMESLVGDVRKANLGISEPGSVEDEIQQFLLDNLPEVKKLAGKMREQ